jgi:predicted P-loop ATPase
MLILVGEQGMKKSAAFRVLASGGLDTTCNDRFSDAPLLGAKDGREVLELSAGVWIQECAELDGITKKDVSALKAMIVRTRDKGRLVWSRTPVEVPRRFVIAGTTNEHRFLQDPTGNRRFWPVEVTRIDLEGLAAARDQILAEALTRYRVGKYRLWLDDAAEHEANKMQGERAVVDQGFYDLLEFMKAEGERDGARYVTNEFVYRRLGLDRWNRAGNVAHKVRAVMTALGWASPPHPVRIDGMKQRIYVWAGEGESPEVDTSPF